MEHNTNRILWTVLILAIGVTLYIGFRPAANGLLHQGVEKIQDVAVSVNSNTSDSSSSHPAVGANLLKGTSSDFQTAPDSPDNLGGGLLYCFSSDELNSLVGKQVTIRAFIHNPTTHTVNLVTWTDANGYGAHSAFDIGTDVPAGTDGYSTITAYNVPSNATQGDISIRSFADNAAISGVQYKELKLEKGSVATPYTP